MEENDENDKPVVDENSEEWLNRIVLSSRYQDSVPTTSIREQQTLSQPPSSDAHRGIKANPTAHEAPGLLMTCEKIKTEPADYASFPNSPCENTKGGESFLHSPYQNMNAEPACESFPSSSIRNIKAEPATFESLKHLSCADVSTEPTACESFQNSPCGNIKAEATAFERFDLHSPCGNIKAEPTAFESYPHSPCDITKAEPVACNTHVSEEWEDEEGLRVKFVPDADTYPSSLQQERQVSSPCSVRHEGKDFTDYREPELGLEPFSAKIGQAMEGRRSLRLASKSARLTPDPFLTATLDPKPKKKPLTSRKKNLQYRTKLLKDPVAVELHKEKTRLRHKLYREGLSDDQRKAWNEKSKLRMQRYRERRKEQGKEKARLRYKLYREGLSDEQRKAWNEKSKLRMQRYRERRKEQGKMASEPNSRKTMENEIERRARRREAKRKERENSKLCEAERRARNREAKRKERANMTPQKKMGINKKRRDKRAAEKAAKEAAKKAARQCTDDMHTDM